MALPSLNVDQILNELFNNSRDILKELGGLADETCDLKLFFTSLDPSVTSSFHRKTRSIRSEFSQFLEQIIVPICAIHQLAVVQLNTQVNLKSESVISQNLMRGNCKFLTYIISLLRDATRDIDSIIRAVRQTKDTASILQKSAQDRWVKVESSKASLIEYQDISVSENITVLAFMFFRNVESFGQFCRIKESSVLKMEWNKCMNQKRENLKTQKIQEVILGLPTEKYYKLLVFLEKMIKALDSYVGRICQVWKKLEQFSQDIAKFKTSLDSMFPKDVESKNDNNMSQGQSSLESENLQKWDKIMKASVEWLTI